MASYRYERDITPGDLAPRREKQYTRRERWANWWDYNLKWVLIIGIAVAFVAYNFIGQYFFTVHADYNVAVVAPHYLPEATQTALQDALAAYGEDRNGDGKVVVKLNVYTMNFGSDDSDAYLDMAGTTKLSTDIQGALSSIFILYDPAGFQSTTGTLRYLDGSLPQSDADNDWWNMVYHWDDCPVLAGLDLGDYTSDAVQNDSGSSQELLSHYYIGIRGASGSGKSSLLNVVSGLVLPDRGTVRWGATVPGALSEHERDRWRGQHIGFVFQDFQLFPELEALENVLLPATFTGWRIPEALIRRGRGLLEQMHVCPTRKVRALSRGEKQRVTIARAVLLKPGIILADEPVAALDPVTAKQVMQDFVHINQELGISILLNIHHVELALEYADRIIGIRAGKIVYDGPSAKVDQAVLDAIYGEQAGAEECV